MLPLRLGVPRFAEGALRNESASRSLSGMADRPGTFEEVVAAKDPPERKRSGWSAEMTRSFYLEDGTTLSTLADARAFILNGPEHIQQRQAWQHAAQLLMEAAEDAGRIEDATRQVGFALLLEARCQR
jgi:hypothetical protein